MRSNLEPTDRRSGSEFIGLQAPERPVHRLNFQREFAHAFLLNASAYSRLSAIMKLWSDGGQSATAGEIHRFLKETPRIALQCKRLLTPHQRDSYSDCFLAEVHRLDTLVDLPIAERGILSLTAYALTTDPRSDSEVEPHLAAVSPFVRQSNINQLVTISAAAARHRYRDVELFDAIEKRLRKLPHDLCSSQNSFWPYARIIQAAGELSIGNESLAHTTLSHLSGNLSALGNNSLSSALYAAALHDNPDFVKRALPELHRRDCSRMHDVDINYSSRALLGFGLQNRVTRAFAMRRTQYYKFLKLNIPAPTSAEKQVFDTLGNAGFRCFLQEPAAGFTIDIVVRHQGVKLAVECDGERNHTTRGPDGGTRTGSDVQREKCLKNLGYRVARVSLKKWFELEPYRRDQIGYLANQICKGLISG